MKCTKKINTVPGQISLFIIKSGLPIIITVFIYIIYRRLSAAPDDLIYMTRSLREMLQYAMMSLVILFAGAAAFEAAEKTISR